MYRLLIVDDEPIIANGLYDFFQDIKELDLDIYRVYSGNEALEWMKRTRIDIVLTDICMPDKTGLDIQKEIRVQWPGCKVIFLTGFNDFDYVQTAIRNDGIDYILKTEGDEAILTAVQKAVSEIEKEIRNEQLIEKAKLDLDLAMPLLRGKYLQDMIEGIEYSGEEIEKNFFELGIPLYSKLPVLLLVGDVDLWPENTGMTEKMKAVYSLQNIAAEYLEKTAVIVSVVHERSKVLWLMQPRVSWSEAKNSEDRGELWEKLKLFVNGSMDSVQQSCKQLLNVSMSFVMSSEAVSWDKVPAKFEALKLMLHKEAGLSSGMLLIESPFDDMGTEHKSELNDYEERGIRIYLKRINILEAMLESGQKKEFLNLLSEIISRVRNNKLCSYELCAEFYYTIATMFISHLNRWKLVDKVKTQINLEKLMKIDAHTSWDELLDYFTKLADCIYEQKNNESFKNANRIFGFIKRYIEQNLNGDLSLTRFAELLHFNPSYLSRMYKQVTGKSLSEYISEVKLERAMDMLKQNELKINEIATVLGFEAPSYFTRFFKKYTNTSPQEYRDSAVR